MVELIILDGLLRSIGEILVPIFVLPVVKKLVVCFSGEKDDRVAFCSTNGMNIVLFDSTENDDGTQEVSFSKLWGFDEGSSEKDSTVVVDCMFTVEVGVWVAFCITIEMLACKFLDSERGVDVGMKSS